MTHTPRMELRDQNELCTWCAPCAHMPTIYESFMYTNTKLASLWFLEKGLSEDRAGGSEFEASLG